MAQRIVDQTINPEDLEALENKKEETENRTKGKDESDKSKAKSSKPGKKSKVRGSKYQSAREKLDKTKTHSVGEAIKELKKVSFATFDESVELHLTLGTDPQNSDHRVRFTTTLPHGTGKSTKVLIISDKDEGKKKNIIYRDEKAADDILNGKLKPGKDFNVVIATPAKMKDISKVARILGPKGMMPSPKAGTVTEDVEKVVKDLSKGQIEIKSQPGHSVTHQIIGKASFTDEQLMENVKHAISELRKNTPAKVKGKFIRKAYLTTSMGPSLRIDA